MQYQVDGHVECYECCQIFYPWKIFTVERGAVCSIDEVLERYGEKQRTFRA